MFLLRHAVPLRCRLFYYVTPCQILRDIDAMMPLRLLLLLR